MKSERNESESGLFRHWLRATFLGWLLGLGLFVLLVLICDLFGGGAQFMVGVGMGAGVGFLQGRVLRKWIAMPWRWWVASTIGMGSLFTLYDLLRLLRVEFPFSSPLYVVLGGLFVGLLQRPLLRPLSARANWWVPACIVGWALPAGAEALGDWKVLGPWRVIFTPLGIILGGVMLGAASGVVIAWILQSAEVKNQQCGTSSGPGSVQNPKEGL